MIPGFDIDALLDSLAERVAAKLGNRPGTISHEGIAPRLLTAEQAATYLGRTKEAIQHMISNGKLPTVRSDRRVFIDVRDLDSWIEDNKQHGIS